ncbi:hypothetical protein GCM10023200_44030 [Actinomycetospora chlora]|uniref:DUF222 domain-containing protein n=1 Tax=Actinomycetospora chlora TaxID=663608 RepID=A0ABP9BXS7_9PSEU
MTTIIDPELTVRLGSLHPDEVARIHDYATAAFLWRGMRQAEALEVARGLHWRAVGRDPDPPAREIVAALALHPLPDADLDRLAGLLDAHDRVDDRREGRAGTRPRIEHHRRTGRRLAAAVILLDTAGTIV